MLMYLFGRYISKSLFFRKNWGAKSPRAPAPLSLIHGELQLSLSLHATDTELGPDCGTVGPRGSLFLNV